MANERITRDEVLDRAPGLPAFPRVVVEILAALDDPDASLELLAAHIRHDPVVTGKVLAMANAAASHSRRQSDVRDVFTATSLIGVGRVRETTLTTHIGHFISGLAEKGNGAGFWQHSVGVGICAEELGLHLNLHLHGDMALVAGLLHDVGQLWMSRFRPAESHACWRESRARAISIDAGERQCFGTDHATVGAWLAEHWALPPPVVAAIGAHHHGAGASNHVLLPLLHVAEVVCNALDIGARSENRVTAISRAACERLGITWNAGIRPLFGRIEARSAHANQIFTNN